MVSCEGFHSLITFNEVYESVDRLQIRVHQLVNLKMNNSLVTVFDSNSHDLSILEKPKKN